MRFANRADGTGPDQFAQATCILAGLALVAHLRGELAFARQSGDLPRFPDRVRERLFAIDMLAQFHRSHRCKGVNMIRRGNDDGVDVLLLVEHLAVVLPLPCLGEFLERAGGVRPIHIAQRDDVVIRKLGDVVPALAGDTDASDVELPAWRCRAVESEHVTGHDLKACGRDRDAAHELAAGKLAGHGDFAWLFRGRWCFHSLYCGIFRSSPSFNAD